METKYVITWTRPDKTYFYIRWIMPDGSFFGEAEDHVRKHITTLEGRIPPDEWSTCRELISKMASGSETLTQGPSEGVLGSWTDSLGSSHIIFRYHRGDETKSPTARLFLELKSIVEQEVVKGHLEITQQRQAG